MLLKYLNYVFIKLEMCLEKVTTLNKLFIVTVVSDFCTKVFLFGGRKRWQNIHGTIPSFIQAS